MNYEIEITRRCNMSCPGCNRLCDIVRQPASTDMDMDDIRKVVSDMYSRDSGRKSISILGGEPTLNRDCVEICRYFSEHAGPGDSVSIGSNYTDAAVLKEAGRYVRLRKDTGKDVPGEVMAVKLGYHANFLLSPKELGDPVGDPRSCYVLRRCGISVHKWEGELRWCWCGPATSLCRLLGREEFMHPTLGSLLMSDREAFFREICPHCAHLSRVMHKAVDTAGRVSACFADGLSRMKAYAGAARAARANQATE